MALIFDMPMQDDAASAAVDDVSASNNNGTASANTNTLTTTGPGGSLTKALSFNGSSQSISVAAIELLDTAAWTFQIFAKRTNASVANSFAGDGDVFGGGYSSIHLVASSNNAAIEADDINTITRTNAAFDSSWHHYAITNTNGVAPVLYVDGVLVGSFSGTLGAGGVIVGTIGRGSPEDLGLRWLGSLAGCRIYDTVRTQQQILTDKLIGLPGGSPLSNKLSLGLGVSI